MPIFGSFLVKAFLENATKEMNCLTFCKLTRQFPQTVSFLILSLGLLTGQFSLILPITLLFIFLSEGEGGGFK